MDRSTDLRGELGFEIVPSAQPLLDALHKLDIDIESVPLNSISHMIKSQVFVNEDVRVVCITLEDRDAVDRFMLQKLVHVLDLQALPDILPIAAFDQTDGTVLLCFLGAVGMATNN